MLTERDDLAELTLNDIEPGELEAVRRWLDAEWRERGEYCGSGHQFETREIRTTGPGDAEILVLVNGTPVRTAFDDATTMEGLLELVEEQAAQQLGIEYW